MHGHLNIKYDIMLFYMKLTTMHGHLNITYDIVLFYMKLTTMLGHLNIKYDIVLFCMKLTTMHGHLNIKYDNVLFYMTLTTMLGHLNIKCDIVLFYSNSIIKTNANTTFIVKTTVFTKKCFMFQPLLVAVPNELSLIQILVVGCEVIVFPGAVSEEADLLVCFVV